VVYVWRVRLYAKGVRIKPLTCGKGGELRRFKHKLRVFDLGRLLVVRVGNLNELKHKLRVFDPGRLLVVRVGNLNDLSTS